MEYRKGCENDRLTVRAKPTCMVDADIPTKIIPK